MVKHSPSLIKTVRFKKENMTKPDIYSVECYTRLGKTVEEAEEIIRQNKEKTSKGLLLALAAKRAKKYGLTISPQELLDIENDLYGVPNIRGSKDQILKFLKKIMEGAKCGYLEAISRYKNALMKFSDDPNAAKKTEFYKELYGEDSEAYKEKLVKNKTYASCSFEKFSENYEDKDLAYKDFCAKYGSLNNDHLKKKLGGSASDEEIAQYKAKVAEKSKETISKWSEEKKAAIARLKGFSLEVYIERHGEAEGKRLYAEHKAGRRYAQSRQADIDRYGEVEGNKRFDSKRSRDKIYYCAEYWVAKGMTEEEAKEKTIEIFATRPHFSKELCVSRYGEKEGIRIWEERQEKWQSTLRAKPQEEMDEINSRKGFTLQSSIEKRGLEEGTKFYLEAQQRRSESFAGFSKEASKFFLRLYRRLRRNGSILDRTECQFATSSTGEFYIVTERGVRMFDFVSEKHKIIVEYHGVYFHPREGDTSWKSAYGMPYEEAFENDRFKKEIAEAKGYVLHTVWSDSDHESELDRLSEIF
jgi:hypothetical protein